MKRYLVTWETEIDAVDPVQAAVEALVIHRDPASIATVFVVWEADSDSDAFTVDALDPAGAYRELQLEKGGN